eukprot:EG_transcript_6542
MSWCFLLLVGFLATALHAEEANVPQVTVMAVGKNLSKCHFKSGHTIVCGKLEYEMEHLAKPGTERFWVSIVISVLLVLGAATAAGLTLGLMSMDLMNLEILHKSGTPAEQHHAARIIPLVKQHHLLLVTLLLVNSCCNEALPLFLDELMHPVTNIIVSVTAVLLFGEIIPQAICTRHGLAIGSYAAPLVWALISVVWVISYPIAKLLDCCLGQETHIYYRRAQLKELVDIHGHPNGQSDGVLSPDECIIIQGAMDLKNKTVEDCLTPIEDVFMLRYDGVMDKSTMQKIATGGHSRIPVFMEIKASRGDTRHEQQVVGMILTRSLIMVNPEEAVPVKSLHIQSVPFVPTTKPLYDMLNMFQEGRSHLAVVVDSRDHLTYRGVVTLEDVLEALIQEPIQDEKDRHRSLDNSHRPAENGTLYGACGVFHGHHIPGTPPNGPVTVSMIVPMAISAAAVSQRTSLAVRDKAGGDAKGRNAGRQQKEDPEVPEPVTIAKSLSM